MSNHIDFYFDIISPYSYIAHKKIQKIKGHQKVIFNYKPILLGGLHNLAGINAPAFNKYKIKNFQSDCELVSKKNNISFKWNLKFPINSLSIMRGYLSVEESQKEDYLNIFFDAYWKDNLDLSSENEISKLLENLKIDSKIFFDKIKQQSIKDALKNLQMMLLKKKSLGHQLLL
jgi:2-hydroxychromene-2-carboxylate isomerase